ncbi:VRR-NUC domain-containing protein [Gammaproteobacteria bacterium]
MSEHDQQAIVVSWAKLHEAQHPELALLFAVPNAGKRSIGAAKYYLAEGLKSGVPDLILPVPRDLDNGRSFVGLAVEMKDGKNKTTEKQDWWLEHLNIFGWYCAVSYSAEAAVKTICYYLEMEYDL